MKKIGILLIALSTVSFANYEQISSKYNKLESELSQLVETENQEFSKISANAENAQNELNQKIALKASIEEKIAKLEQVSSSKYYQKEYVDIVKEYKNVVANLDSEIKSLSKTVNDYNSIIALRGGK